MSRHLPEHNIWLLPLWFNLRFTCERSQGQDAKIIAVTQYTGGI